MTIPDLLTVPEAAQHARLTERTLWRLIARGVGPAVTRLGGSTYIRTDRLGEWIEDNTTTSAEADVEDDKGQADDMGTAPNEATRIYRARIAAQTARSDADRKSKGNVASLREQQRRAGSGSGGTQLRAFAPATELEEEATRARRAEQALKHG